jgi:hypothetical protein
MIEDILSRLSKVKRTGSNNWLACCPAHEDRSPSMSIRAEDDGRILVHCHGGCSFEEIVGAVGLGWEPWFPPKPIEHAKAVKRPYPAGDVMEALVNEAALVAVAAANVSAGVELTEDDKERLFLAYQRISEGRRLANGER